MKRDRYSHLRCDGVNRREVLRIGALTALGLTVPDWLRLRASEAAKTATPRCILIWLDGGPSHLDTFDLKPEAPSEVRGPFKPIATRVPGIQVSEYLPLTAQIMDRVAIIRSMTSPLGEHNFASHYLLTGYKPTPALRYPSFGAVVARMQGHEGAFPPYIAIPNYNAMAGEGYLPTSCRPFAVGGDPGKPDFRVRDLSPPGDLTLDRLQRRKNFREAFDQFNRQLDEPSAEEDPEFAQAYRLILSPQARQAFDLERESRKVRDRYGRRSLGQSCLLARRLIERGVPFVTVTDRGWDTHNQLFNRLKEGYTGGSVGKVPVLDQAFSALLEDLDERGLLKETLIVAMGEFGRTPKLNTLGGRDHWPRVFSAVLAGAGVRGGQVIGRSDARGESPAHQPVTPEDLACTIYRLLGIDPRHAFRTRDGRPVQINQKGKEIAELI